MTTVAVATLGCKVNQFESEALMASLERAGYRLVPFGDMADITIINTCTVTHRADFQSRQMIRRACRFNPQSLVVVTGCYSQVDPEAIVKTGAAQYLVGNGEKNRIPDLLPRMQEGTLPRILVGDIQNETCFADTPLHSFHLHTRAFLKIQDGCDARCSYCIVPYARGRSRSLPPKKVFEHLRKLRVAGFKEAVLTGIHIGAYGLDLVPPLSLIGLLEELEREDVPGRIRLSSIEPGDFSSDLVSSLFRSTKICPHLHIPIQSGDDALLKRMNRDYDRSFLFDLIQSLHNGIPDLSIGADVIVGFSGETEEMFRHTWDLIESLPFSYLHVFPFSRRKGTPAFQFSDRVDEGKIRNRAEALRELGRQKRQDFYGRFLNWELKVLLEGRKKKGMRKWHGFSRNYIPVLLEDGGDHSDRVNQEWTVLVTGTSDQGVVGRIVGE